MRRWLDDIVPVLGRLHERMRGIAPTRFGEASHDELDLIGTDDWTTGGVENEYGSTEGPHDNHDAQVCFKEINS